MVTLLNWTSFSKRCLLGCLSNFFESDKLGLSLFKVSEFAEMSIVLLIKIEEGPNVIKLTIYKTFVEKSSEKVFRPVKEVSRFESSKNLHKPAI